jgi:hypothetical protein
VFDVTIPQGTVRGACNQELVACFRHEGENCPRCNDSGAGLRKRCAGCGEHCSLMRNPTDSKMYCLSCNPRFFGAQLKIFEEISS